MKKVLLLTALIAFVASSAFAQVPAKPFTVYIGGGLGMPMSPDGFKDNQKTGIHGMAQLGFNSFPKGQFVLNLEYHKFGGDWQDPLITGGGGWGIIMAGADARLNLGLPAAPINPHLFAGVGLAVHSFSDFETTSGTISLPIDSQNDFYFQIGGGLNFNQIFVRLRYVNIMTEGESSSFIPATVGIQF